MAKTIQDEFYRCKNEFCVGKKPTLRYILQYHILRPRGMEKAATAEPAGKVWYCCHCNNRVAEIPKDIVIRREE